MSRSQKMTPARLSNRDIIAFGSAVAVPVPTRWQRLIAWLLAPVEM